MKLLRMVINNFTHLSLVNSSTFQDLPLSFTYFLVGTILLAAVSYFALKSNCVFLIDFTCYLPADYLRSPTSHFTEHTELSGVFSRESLDFQKRVIERSGIGDEACFPLTMHEIPVDTSFNSARKEVEEVLFTVVEDLFSKNSNSTHAKYSVGNKHGFGMTSVTTGSYSFHAQN